MQVIAIKQIILCFCAVLASSVLNAQKIELSFPKEANKRYTFVLNKGLNQDTIQRGTFSFTGSATVQIPEKYKGYVGIGALRIEGSPALNLVVDKASFKVEQNNIGKYKFTNSKENDYLYTIIQEKATPAEDATLYASNFVKLMHYVRQLNAATNSTSLMNKASARNFALTQLNMEQLYTSGLWFYVIDGVIRLNPDQESIGETMISVLKRTKSQEVFEYLVKNIITITGQYGWDDAFDIIIPYVEQSGRIKYPQGEIYTAFTLSKVRKGMMAPVIEGLKPSIAASGVKKTLLFFYEPDCENCRLQIETLIKRYRELNQKGIRIVSISSDNDKQSLDKDKKRFPWPDSDKLCDFKGFSGKNYLSYGIMATPTLFLVAKDGRIIKRAALVSDINFDADLEK